MRPVRRRFQSVCVIFVWKIEFGRCSSLSALTPCKAPTASRPVAMLVVLSRSLAPLLSSSFQSLSEMGVLPWKTCVFMRFHSCCTLTMPPAFVVSPYALNESSTGASEGSAWFPLGSHEPQELRYLYQFSALSLSTIFLFC